MSFAFLDNSAPTRNPSANRQHRSLLTRQWDRIVAAWSTKGKPARSLDPLMPTIERLDDSYLLRTDRWRSWLVTLLIGAFAFLIRLRNLGFPNYLVFDETYYAKDAYGLLRRGYEVSWPDNANDQIKNGVVDVFKNDPAFIVHPQLGKWLIAIGEHVFGMNAFGWRFMSLVFGTLLVIATIRLARRLSRSTLIGALAGFFLAVDGLSFMMSRIALLDIFEAAFTVMAVTAVVADRDWVCRKLADHLCTKQLTDLGGQFGPLLLFRPWLWTSGLLFGAAIACKWNAMYVLAVMGVAAVVYELRSRITAGADASAWRALFVSGPLAFLAMVVTSVLVYVASWWSWLTTNDGWSRNWGAEHPNDPVVKVFGQALGSLWHYHQEIYNFHTGQWIADQSHIYQSHPFQWLVMGRVIGIDAVNGLPANTEGCTAQAGDSCLRVISGMGTPFLWWFALAAVIAGFAYWWFGRDQRFAFPLLAASATWLMWLPNAERPLFFFYAIMLIPFNATVLAMVCGKILGPADGGRRRRIGAVIVGTMVLIIVANFWFIYPILTDQLMTRTAWSLRMWFKSWI